MRRSCTVIHLSVSLALLLSASGLTYAGIRPSFFLDDCAWHATDIVLVEDTTIPGVFRVIESWKGSLEPGNSVTVPELQPLNGAIEIAAYPKRFEGLRKGGSFEQIPAQSPGARMVLFLKNNRTNRRWQSADSFGGMRTSAVWIDDGQLYVFRQLANPGPSTLVTWDMTFDKMRNRIEDIRQTEFEVTSIADLKDGFQRARGLKGYVLSDIREAQQLALSELGKSGQSAVPAIREMLSDSNFSDEESDLIKELAEAGGESVGAELDEHLQEQLRFWQTNGPGLTTGWWNQDASPHAPLRDRYIVTIELVRALERIHYRPAVATAQHLADFWRSLPQLDDPSGLDEMAAECDHLVATLRTN
jgi:hypothetical protein